MRLINADELKEQFAWSELCRLSIKEINQFIDEAPTVEQRSQGEWITINPLLYQCSSCLEYIMDKHDYCPNCGAFMRSDNNGKK